MYTRIMTTRKFTVTDTSHTLSEALTILGYAHRPSHRVAPGVRTVLMNGATVYEGRWHEVWAWLICTGQVEMTDAVASIRQNLEGAAR